VLLEDEDNTYDKTADAGRHFRFRVATWPLPSTMLMPSRTIRPRRPTPYSRPYPGRLAEEFTQPREIAGEEIFALMLAAGGKPD